MASGSGVPTFTGKVETFVERLDSYFAFHGTAADKQKHVLIMGLSETQYETLASLTSPEKPNEKDYDTLVTTLRSHFGQVTNKMVERARFREVKRRADEAIADFVIRLRAQARTCEFGANLGENLVEQFRIGVNSKVVRDRIAGLTDEKQGDLQEVIKVAQRAEVDEKLDSMKLESMSLAEPEQVSAVRRPDRQHTPRRSPSQPGRSNQTPRECYRCKSDKHLSSSKQCPALSRTCHVCNKKGHYAGSKFCKGESVATVDDGASVVEEASSDGTLFSVNHVNSKMPRCMLNIMGETIPFIIDTGACNNIISRTEYSMLKAKHQVVLEQPDDSNGLFGYGSNRRLDILGTFKASVECGSKRTHAVFYVFNGVAKCLLSNKTATDLSLLSYSHDVVCNVLPEVAHDIFSSYPTVFQGLGKLKGFKVKFHVDKGVEPVAQPVRRLPIGFWDKVKKKLGTLVADDVIERAVGVPSRWSSPLVCVLRDSGEIRMTVDMRQANRAILRERHPIPTTKEMLANLEGGRIFSKLDMNQGFHQVELDEESRDITTFSTPFGLYRYRRLTMGVNASPEYFQYIIQQALSGLEGVQNMADDIILHAKTVEEHDRRLKALLERLRHVGVTLNPKKCQLRMNSVKFLGFIVSDKGVSADPEKVRAVVNFKAPQNATECRSFMGLVNFVGRFIPDLATVSEPIRRLMHKKTVFHWEKPQQDAFNKIKALMGNADTLAHYEVDAKTKLIADASPYGLGAVLIQEQQGVERVISYGHRALSDIERRYSQTEREALALVWASEHFMLYLLGSEFELITDHKPLEFIFNNPSSKPVPRIERWSLRLQSFKYRVVYQKGARNIADPLSRMVSSVDYVPLVATIVGDQYAESVARESVPIALDWDFIVEKSRECQEVKGVGEAIQANDFGSCAISYRAVSTELSQVQGVLLRGNRIVIPVSLRNHVVQLAHEGHQGVVKTKQRLRSKVWWPGVDKDAESFCRRCIDCMTVSQPDPPHRVSMTKFPEKPWSYLSTDLLGPLPNGQSIIVLVDYYSRFFECAFLTSTKTEKIIEFMDTVFARFGYCDALRSDNGPQFTSEEFQTYLRQNNIKWVSTTPLWPQANGEVERVNRTLLKVLKIAHESGQRLGKELRKFLMAYRSTPHSSTGVAPFTLLCGREMKTKLPSMDLDFDKSVFEQAAENDAKSKARNKEYADRHSREPDIHVGDTVLMKKDKRGKLDGNFGREKQTVVAKQGSEVIVRDENGKTTRRNSTFVKVVPKTSDIGQPVSESMPCSPDSQVECPTSSAPQRCSSRLRKPPDRYGDFVVHALGEKAG